MRTPSACQTEAGNPSTMPSGPSPGSISPTPPTVPLTPRRKQEVEQRRTTLGRDARVTQNRPGGSCRLRGDCALLGR